MSSGVHFSAKIPSSAVPQSGWSELSIFEGSSHRGDYKEHALRLLRKKREEWIQEIASKQVEVPHTQITRLFEVVESMEESEDIHELICVVHAALELCLMHPNTRPIPIEWEQKTEELIAKTSETKVGLLHELNCCKEAIQFAKTSHGKKVFSTLFTSLSIPESKKKRAALLQNMKKINLHHWYESCLFLSWAGRAAWDEIDLFCSIRKCFAGISHQMEIGLTFVDLFGFLIWNGNFRVQHEALFFSDINLLSWTVAPHPILWQVRLRTIEVLLPLSSHPDPQIASLPKDFVYERFLSTETHPYVRTVLEKIQRDRENQAEKVSSEEMVAISPSIKSLQSSEAIPLLYDALELLRNQNRERLDQAVSLLNQGARLGNPLAQLYMGFVYSENRSEKRKEELKDHAKRGNTIASDLLLLSDVESSKDPAKAFGLYKLAAAQQQSYAQYLVADCYFFGEGAAKDESQAIFWYEKAGNLGHLFAQYHLGVYFNEEGKQKNQYQAFTWLTRAATQGYSLAQFELGKCYMDGNGVSKNIEVASSWFSRAADQGHLLARELFLIAICKGM